MTPARAQQIAAKYADRVTADAAERLNVTIAQLCTYLTAKLKLRTPLEPRQVTAADLPELRHKALEHAMQLIAELTIELDPEHTPTHDVFVTAPPPAQYPPAPAGSWDESTPVARPRRKR